jgi:hypothetical protein
VRARELMTKLNRLCGMTPREIHHRLRAKLRRQADRAAFCLGRGSRKGLLDFRELAGRFYFPLLARDRERLARWVQEHYPEWIARSDVEAQRICRHRIGFPGWGELDLGPEIDWHRDPITGRTWRRRFWADYKLVRDCSGGDPKVVHEINRHQYLARLAKAHFLTGKEQYAREAVSQMESWIAQNPESRSVNWESSLELAIRSLSWLWTISFLMASGSVPKDAAERCGASLFAQLDHIYRYPSIFTSPNTHVMGEAAALWIAGSLFRDHQRAKAWRAMGFSLLAGEMQKQVFDDGVHGELSSYYHCYAIDFYLQALVLARRNGPGFPLFMWQRLSRMLEFLMHVSKPDGSLPLLGDDDGGRALALVRAGYPSFREALCSGAVLFNRGDFKRQAGGFHEETFWLLGEEGWRRYCEIESAAPASREASFPKAGYFIQRSGWTPRAHHLIFDCGGFGILSGGHAHADALSFTVSAAGADLIVDPGTYLYNCEPAWRRFFRSTRAHNTVVIDNRDQAAPAGTFSWRSKPPSRVLSRFSCDGAAYIEAEHSGYLSASPGVIHRRRLLFAKPCYWILIDDFRGTGNHQFDFYYHFSPELALAMHVAGGRQCEIVLSAAGETAGLLLHIFPSEALSAAIFSGWISRRYGHRQPAPVLQAGGFCPAALKVVTVLFPIHQPASPWAARRIPAGRALALALRNGVRQDLLILPENGSEARVANFRMAGDLFWLRLEHGALRQALAIRAQTLCEGNAVVFENREPLPYFWAEPESSPSEDDLLCAGYAES